MTSASDPEPNISLEAHLAETLRPLPSLLPNDLADKLTPYLVDPLPNLIPYSLLYAISRWARSNEGHDALRAQCPKLDPQSYSMVSLLAGTTTSPDRFFGEYIPPKDPAVIQAENNREKKAITALINALLSIGGSAVATWYAAEKTGWRNEWRVLLALFVAITVAVAEGILFLIWQSRASKITNRKTRGLNAKHKKDSDISSTRSEIGISSSILNRSELEPKLVRL